MDMTEPTTSRAVGLTEIGKALSATTKAAQSTVGLAGEAWAAWQQDALGDFARDLLENPAPLIGTAQDIGEAVRAINRLAPLVDQVRRAALPPVLRIASVKVASDALRANGNLPAGGGLVGSIAQLGSPLGLVNVGVGLTNLGVGLYNAYQVTKMRAELSAMHAEMTAAFRGIQAALDVQSRQLAVLLEGQAALGQQVEKLRREMLQGFTAVLEQLGDVESRRRAEELQVRSLKVTKSWQCTIDALAEGDRPSENELRRLADAALDLEAWADTLLPNLPAGSPGRLPYFVAKSLAVRAAADAKTIETGGATRAAVRQIERLVEEIEAEARCLVDGKTLYQVGVTLAPVLAQYVCLRRGLKAGCATPELGDGVGTWDDGLADLRLLARALTTEAGEDCGIQLGTIGDLHWYLEWSGSAPTTDLRGITDVRCADVLGSIGVPGSMSVASSAALPGLLMMALPRYRSVAEQRMNEEFQWAARASLSRGEAVDPSALKPQEPPAGPGPFAGRVVTFDGLKLVFALPNSAEGRRAVLQRGDMKLGLYEYDYLDGKREAPLRLTAKYPDGWHAELASRIHVYFINGRKATVVCALNGQPARYAGSWFVEA